MGWKSNTYVARSVYISPEMAGHTIT